MHIQQRNVNSCSGIIIQDGLNTFPHSSTGLIILYNKERVVANGTGFLIDKDIVMTVAHIFDQLPKSDEIYFYPAFIGSLNKEHGIKVLNNIKKHQKFVPLDLLNKKIKLKQDVQEHIKRNNKFDYALLKLSKEININFIVLPSFSMQKIQALKQQLIHQEKEGFICGYLKFKYITEQYTENYFQVKQNGSLISIKDQMIYYKINTEDGLSGSPIYYQQHLVGIHKGFPTQFQTNYGLLLTPQIIQQIKKWYDELNNDGLSSNQSQSAANSQSDSMLDESQESMSSGSAEQLLNNGMAGLSLHQNNLFKKTQETTHSYTPITYNQLYFQVMKKQHQNMIQNKGNEVKKINSPETICKVVIKKSISRNISATKFKIENYGQGCEQISFGILTKQYMDSENEYDNNQIIRYWTEPINDKNPGGIIINGQQIKTSENLLIGEGNGLEIIINKQERQIKFIKQFVPPVRCELSNYFLEQEIYLFIDFKAIGSAVRIEYSYEQEGNI